MGLQIRMIFTLVFACFYLKLAAAPPVHVWEMQELVFTAQNPYQNAYTDMTV